MSVNENAIAAFNLCKIFNTKFTKTITSTIHILNIYSRQSRFKDF